MALPTVGWNHLYQLLVQTISPWTCSQAPLPWEIPQLRLPLSGDSRLSSWQLKPRRTRCFAQLLKEISHPLARTGHLPSPLIYTDLIYLSPVWICLLWLSHTNVDMCHQVIVQSISTPHVHLSCFWFGAGMKKCARNIPLSSWWVCKLSLLLRCVFEWSCWAIWLVYMCCSEERLGSFPSYCSIAYPHQRCRRIPSSHIPHILAHSWYGLSWFQPHCGCGVLSVEVWICISLMTNGAEHPFRWCSFQFCKLPSHFSWWRSWSTKGFSFGRI